MRFNQKARPLARPIALFIFLLCATASTRAEINVPGSPPSEAVPLKVHVARGSAVTIKLSVYGPPEPVTFLIRSRPDYGKLSANSVEGHGDAFIAYRHSGEKYQTSDHFTYAAKTSDGVSPAVNVTILIDDPPAQLAITPQLDFGDVPVGETKELVVELANSGGAPAAGTANTDVPWQLEDGPAYRVAGGTKQKLRIVFTPDHVGPAEGSIIYSTDRTLVTELYGRGVESFYLDSGTLNLQSRERNTEATAKVAVHNRMRDTLTLQISAPAPLQVPETLQIPPLSSADLTVSAPAGQAVAIDDYMNVSDGTFTARLRVIATAQPAILALDHTTLDFGKVEASKTSTATITIKNTGGSPAGISASIPAPFEIAETDRKFDLNAGASRTIAVKFVPAQSGTASATLAFQSDAQNLAATCTAEALPAPAIIRTSQQPTFDITGATLASPASQELAKIPAVSDLHATLVKPTSITLEWTAPHPDPSGYDLQQLTLFRNAHEKLGLEWRSIAKPGIHIAGDKITAKVGGLVPTQFLIARVVSLDARGLPSKPSPEVRIQTPERKWPSLLHVLFAALLVLIGLIARNKWKNRNAPISGF